jgi:hypothetical protein
LYWSTIFGWLKPAKAGVLNVKTEVPNFSMKHKEIPVLKDYEKDPGENFGISFRHFSGKCDKKCKHLQSEKRVQKF